MRKDTSANMKVGNQSNRARMIESMGNQSCTAAHDFNNLLCIINGNLELLDRELSDDQRRIHLGKARMAVEMAVRLAHRLRSAPHQNNVESTPVNINTHVENTVDLLRSTFSEKITISTTLLPELWQTMADPSEIENVLINLAINARDAMPIGGSIFIDTANVDLQPADIDIKADLKPGQYVRLILSDNGSGMKPEIKPRVFEPFFSTKADKEGTGLGLSSIREFAERYGGTATVYSRLGQGTSVQIYLPRYVGTANGAL